MTSGEPLSLPEMISVYEYPAYPGTKRSVTVGQMLQGLYGDFAITLAKFKAEGTLANWIDKQLSGAGPLDNVSLSHDNRIFNARPSSKRGEILHLSHLPDRGIYEIYIESLVDGSVDSDKAAARAKDPLPNLELLEAIYFGYIWDPESDYPPLEDEPPYHCCISDLAMTYWHPGTIRNIHEALHRPEPIYDHYDPYEYPVTSIFHLRLWAAKLGERGERVFDLADEIHFFLLWNLFCSLFPQSIPHFCQGNVPALPEDIKLPYWGSLQDKHPPGSLEQAAESYKHALSSDRSLRAKKDKEVWAWLHENEPQKGYDLPNKDTWMRYIREARKMDLLRHKAERPPGRESSSS